MRIKGKSEPKRIDKSSRMASLIEQPVRQDMFFHKELVYLSPFPIKDIRWKMQGEIAKMNSRFVTLPPEPYLSGTMKHDHFDVRIMSANTRSLRIEAWFEGYLESVDTGTLIYVKVTLVHFTFMLVGWIIIALVAWFKLGTLTAGSVLFLFGLSLMMSYFALWQSQRAERAIGAYFNEHFSARMVGERR